MKICMIGPSYPFRGGISHYTTLLYKHLKKNHDIDFYSFKRQYPQWLFPGKSDKDNSRKPIKEEGIKSTIDSLNPLTWWKTFLSIKKENPQLIIIPWWVSFWIPQFWLLATLSKSFTKAKILFICHNVEGHELKSIYKISTSLVLRKGDYFIVHSDAELNNLKKIIPDANVSKCFHPSYEIFCSQSITKEEARKKINIKGRVILFFGIIRPYKGLNYLIEAMPKITKLLDVTLLIVGEFWKGEAKYRKQIKKLGVEENIRIINKYIPNEDVEIYFAASDLVVLPYISTTGSGVVQVAFGCDKPVLSTNIGSLCEIIDDRRTGYSIPPRNSHKIAEMVLSFYQQEKEEEFMKNIKKVKEKFSWARMVETIEKFMN